MAVQGAIFSRTVQDLLEMATQLLSRDLLPPQVPPFAHEGKLGGNQKVNNIQRHIRVELGRVLTGTVSGTSVIGTTTSVFAEGDLKTADWDRARAASSSATRVLSCSLADSRS